MAVGEYLQNLNIAYWRQWAGYRENAISQLPEGLVVRKWAQIHSRDKGDDEFDTSHGAGSKELEVGEQLQDSKIKYWRYMAGDKERLTSQRPGATFGDMYDQIYS